MTTLNAAATQLEHGAIHKLSAIQLVRRFHAQAQEMTPRRLSLSGLLAVLIQYLELLPSDEEEWYLISNLGGLHARL